MGDGVPAADFQPLRRRRPDISPARVGERRTGVAGLTLLVVSMLMFVVAGASDIVGLVFAGLALSGLAMGTSMPSLVTVVANTVSTGDLGVANAAQQMVGQIGTVAGIQLLSTLHGGSVDAGPFASAYVVGCDRRRWWCRRPRAS